MARRRAAAGWAAAGWAAGRGALAGLAVETGAQAAEQVEGAAVAFQHEAVEQRVEPEREDKVVRSDCGEQSGHDPFIAAGEVVGLCFHAGRIIHLPLIVKLINC
jgi:hypothetical protein